MKGIVRCSRQELNQNDRKRYQVRCHEWGDDSDYFWDSYDTLEEAQRAIDDFYKKDPDNNYEHLYIIDMDENNNPNNIV